MRYQKKANREKIGCEEQSDERTIQETKSNPRFIHVRKKRSF